MQIFKTILITIIVLYSLLILGQIFGKGIDDLRFVLITTLTLIFFMITGIIAMVIHYFHEEKVLKKESYVD